MRKTESFPLYQMGRDADAAGAGKAGRKLSQRTDRRVFAALFLLAVISWIIPLHPKTSEAGEA